jgi:hypothetical protein
MLKKRLIKNIYIYVLKDPESNEVRYIGKTKRTLKYRLQRHLTDTDKNHKVNWIQSLKNKNLIPLIESIEVVTDSTWAEREVFWIEHYNSLGCNLTNSHAGGISGHNPTAETRAKISAAKKGTMISHETRIKMSTARKEYWAKMKREKFLSSLKTAIRPKSIR